MEYFGGLWVLRLCSGLLWFVTRNGTEEEPLDKYYEYFALVNYPENHERRKFQYHFYKGHINDEVVIGVSVVMLSQIISTVILGYALKESRKMSLLYGILFCAPFTFASLPIWPIAIVHTALALGALSFVFS
ncbi:uncharacterized protein Dana_GF27140, isoform A [Drosophila ananassae]|uniref:Uncharacterized protein, isoform A n=1 Tax=Drosophila ananassae TaxID=7217 RepID=A0A0P8XRL5_DROAN|nr:uncharacterized protein LOC26514549 isoform X1 [Drosophila ananassae]XP_044571286.1 uncharacterized protein LOC26514549 isoform X1 [Drosophila ananassae]KPU77215.1 uncharacterized protein Dana_GF27140, isoform A [Drosophila ananassae]